LKTERGLHLIIQIDNAFPGIFPESFPVVPDNECVLIHSFSKITNPVYKTGFVD
jgi:hypothetical protein